MNKTEEFLKNKENANLNNSAKRINVSDKIKDKQIKKVKFQNTAITWLIKILFVFLLSFAISAEAVGGAVSYFIFYKLFSLLIKKIISYFCPLEKIAFLGKRTLDYILDVLFIVTVAIGAGFQNGETISVIIIAVFCDILAILMKKTLTRKLNEINNIYNPKSEILFTEAEIKDFIKNPKDSDKEKQEIYVMLEKLSKDNASVNSQLIKEKTSNIIKLSKEILEKGKNLTTNKKFFYYYLPEVDKIQDKYIEMSKKGINSDNFIEFENKFQSVIGQIEKAFVKIHDTMYEDEIYSANFDLNVLEKTLTRDGLIEDNEFTIDWSKLKE